MLSGCRWGTALHLIVKRDIVGSVPTLGRSKTTESHVEFCHGGKRETA